jgi:uncharacterized membrane protein
VKHRLSKTGFNPKGATVPEETPQTGLSDNAASGLAYITFIPAIIFLVTAPYNQKSLIRFHSWQSIFLAIAWVAIWIVLAIFGTILSFAGLYLFMGLLFGLIHLLLWLGFLIVWVLCLVKAFNGERFKLPFIGDLAAKQAGA